MKANIEIKARCSNLDDVRQILELERADFKGIDHQIDTYFKVENGRLKLREGNIENRLIHYCREDTEDPKLSNVLLYSPSDKSLLKELLSKALGILTIVDKEREIYYIDNVKFHIDKVKDLGTFVEIEAQGTDEEKGELLSKCKYYMKLLRINDKDLVPFSYSDMILQKVG